MRHLILLAFTLATLAGCSKSGGAAAGSSVVTPGGPALDATPLVYASITPKVDAAGGTLVTVTGDFDTTNVNGKFDDGRWVASITVTTASGNVCTQTQFTPHEILCTFDASYIGGVLANGLLEITEDVTITRVLNDGFTETVDAGNVAFNKTAQLVFGSARGWNLQGGKNYGFSQGWWTDPLLGTPLGTVTAVTPYVTGYTVTNTGAGDATLELDFPGGGSFEAPYASTCGTPDVNGYFHGTLASGQSCTFTLQVFAALSGSLSTNNPALVGTVKDQFPMVLIYDDNLGNSIHTVQNINEVYSN
jgi:hypothetical protein